MLLPEIYEAVNLSTNAGIIITKAGFFMKKYLGHRIQANTRPFSESFLPKNESHGRCFPRSGKFAFHAE
jgi:hypothetical protein